MKLSRDDKMPALKKMLKSADFKVEAIFDDMTFKNPKEKSERMFFVCRKI